MSELLVVSAIVAIAKILLVLLDKAFDAAMDWEQRRFERDLERIRRNV